MPLPIIAVVAARLGIRLATYMVGKQLKKGAAKKLRKAITEKKAEIAKKKEGAGKGFRGKGSKRKEEKVVQRKKKDKPKVDSGLSIEESKKLKKVLDRKEKEWRDLSKKEDEQSMGTPTSSSQLFRLYGKIRKK